MIAPLLAAVAFALALPPLPPANGVVVPPGYEAHTWATGLKHPTALAWGPDNRLYASNDVGKIASVVRGSSEPRTLENALPTVLGLAWRGRSLYASAQGEIVRIDVDRRGRMASMHVLIDGLPYGRHQQDNILFGRDGRLYFGSGSTCDACAEKHKLSATVLSMKPNGKDLRIVSTGLRNPYGLVRGPGGVLYASVNGRDDIDAADDPEPAEMIVRIAQGRRFGWPSCWPSYKLLRLAGSCDGVTAPLAYLEPHSSADGLAFWRGSLYVAEWGQYCCTTFGRKLVQVDLSRRPARVTTFATGFPHPLALIVDRQTGGLLVADWERGEIDLITKRP